MDCYPLGRARSLFTCLMLGLLCLVPSRGDAQASADTAVPDHRHSLDFSPMSPLFKIYTVQVGYRYAPGSEVFVGPYYARIHFEDIGHTDAPGVIIGIRQYVWGKFHVDYQIIPQWDHFYEENEDKRYPLGFDLWNEFRLGYTWDFRVGSLPAYLNVQWPLGWALYSDDSAKPASFKAKANDEPLFWYPPMFFIGVRF